MARYDRIARLDCPERDHVFGCWLTLRDLEGREREPDLGRRARLRFLALRPVRRLLQRGLDGPAADSLDLQLDAVRKELGQLPSRDPERQRLSDYLREIGGRTPLGMANATLDVGAAAEAAGHRYAAEEFYRTALELAETHDLTDQRLVALRRLGRVHRDRQEWEQAADFLSLAARLADQANDGIGWARAMDATATLHERQGDTPGAHQVLERMAERGAQLRDDRIIARAAAGRCRTALAEGRTEQAVVDGWNAVRMMDPSDEDRAAALLDLAAALRRLGLHQAAASAYNIVSRWAAWPEHRMEARVEQAVVAAEGGDEDTVRALRSELLETVERLDPHMTSLVELGLARATLLIGDTDDSRDHLRTAIGIARDHDLTEMLRHAEEMLTALESPQHKAPRHQASQQARAVAERVVELSRDLVPAD